MARETWVQSQVESYQRLHNWYLMPPCLTLCIIRYGSRVKWSNPGKGVAPSPTLWCSKLSKREPSGHPRLWSPTLLYMYSEKERKCKGSVSSIVTFLKWTSLHGSVWRLRHFYSSKGKRKKEKREREKKDCWETFSFDISCWLNIAGILKRKGRRKNDCFLTLIIICLVVAY